MPSITVTGELADRHNPTPAVLRRTHCTTKFLLDPATEPLAS